MLNRQEGLNYVKSHFELTKVEIDKLQCHCDNCKPKCEFAYDPYNWYGGDISDTGCLMEK